MYILCLDYVLVYTEEEGKQVDVKHLQFREKFLGNLKKSKVEMEEVRLTSSIVHLYAII